jgi:hypothetical protein
MKVYRLYSKRHDCFLGAGLKMTSKNGLGKTWPKLGFLKSAIRYQFTDYLKRTYGKEVPDDWEVVEYEMVETNRMSAKDMHEEKHK